MKVFRSFLFFVLALAFCGCNPCQYYAHRCASVESWVDSIWRFDTLIVERIITDTVQIVSLPKENAAIVAVCPDTAKAETSLAFAWAYLNGGQILLRLYNKDTAAIRVTKVTERSNKKSVTGQQTTVTHRVTEYRTRPFVKCLAWCGGVALILIVVYIALKIGSYLAKR